MFLLLNNFINNDMSIIMAPQTGTSMFIGMTY